MTAKNRWLPFSHILIYVKITKVDSYMTGYAEWSKYMYVAEVTDSNL